MKDRPIRISIITGKPSLNGKRLKSADGMTWRQRNCEAVNARRRQLYAAEPVKHRNRSARYKKANREKVNKLVRAGAKRHRARLRAEMILAYGAKCACCGESEPLFLQLDHCFNDGCIERKVYKTNARLWTKLKKDGWPKARHQLLCANCNFGKLLNKGICPHHAKDRS